MLIKLENIELTTHELILLNFITSRSLDRNVIPDTATEFCTKYQLNRTRITKSFNRLITLGILEKTQTFNSREQTLIKCVSVSDEWVTSKQFVHKPLVTNLYKEIFNDTDLTTRKVRLSSKNTLLLCTLLSFADDKWIVRNVSQRDLIDATGFTRIQLKHQLKKLEQLKILFKKVSGGVAAGIVGKFSAVYLVNRVAIFSAHHNQKSSSTNFRESQIASVDLTYGDRLQDILHRDIDKLKHRVRFLVPYTPALDDKFALLPPRPTYAYEKSLKAIMNCARELAEEALNEHRTDFITHINSDLKKRLYRGADRGKLFENVIQTLNDKIKVLLTEKMLMRYLTYRVNGLRSELSLGSQQDKERYLDKLETTGKTDLESLRNALVHIALYFALNVSSEELFRGNHQIHLTQPTNSGFIYVIKIPRSAR